MPSYRVHFFKVVLDDTGHEHRACQAAVDVVAGESEDAVRKAQGAFSDMQNVRDWRIYADEYAVEMVGTEGAADAARARL